MATEKRLIYARDLWSDIMMLPHNGDMISSEEVEHAIMNAPTVDAVEVVHGRWIWRNKWEPFEFRYECSICHEGSDLESNYCQNCGAKMDGGNKND